MIDRELRYRGLLAMTSTAIIIGVISLLLASMAFEWAEKKCRKYYTDQFLLRASGFCIGAAVTIALIGLTS